ncbi:MAG: hypothetical protein WC533_00525 [Candidatus Pacearchaeota archaeon]
MITRVCALDIYGTVLDSEDVDNAMPVRDGFQVFVRNCQKSKILLVSISDQPEINVKLDLDKPFRKAKLSIDIFNRYYQLTTIPKDVRQILQDYRLTPE